MNAKTFTSKVFPPFSFQGLFSIHDKSGVIHLVLRILSTMKHFQ